jgi:hypothetical protein
MSEMSTDNQSAARPTRAATSKIAKPDLWYGERTQLEPWLLQWDIYFHVEDQVKEEDKAMITISYMRGNAQQWAAPKLKSYFDKSTPNLVMIFEDFDEFKTELRKDFSVPKEPIIAEGKIQRLKQKGTVGDYANLFQRYSIQTEWDDKALMRMFKQGLRPEVRIELMRSGGLVENLQGLIEEAIRIDNNIMEFRLETRGPEDSKFQKNYRANDKKQRGGFRPRVPGYYESNGPESMHLNNIERGKPRNDSNTKYRGKGKPENGKETRTCYNCGKPGHLSAKCRQPKKNTVSRHVNMIEQEGSEEEGSDWEVVGSFSGPFDNNEETREMINKIQDEFIRDGTIRSKETPGSDNDSSDKLSQLDITGGCYRFQGKEPAQESGPLIVRSPSPHPGRKVHTAWDNTGEETPSSPMYYHDNTNQVFVTPPDSPVLGRKATSKHQKGKRASTSKKSRSRHEGDAVYVNDHQGVALYEEGTIRSAQEARRTMSTPEYENWVERETREFALRQAKVTDNYQFAPSYAIDPRNPLHPQMTWTACDYDSCSTHYDDKSLAGWFPTPQSGCRWEVYDCQKHACTRHLWAKRETGVFPGLSEEEISVNQVLVNNRCANDDWQLCLRHQCTRHQEVKRMNGFDELPEPFLGKRPQARKFYPRAAMRSTQHPSTSSQ